MNKAERIMKKKEFIRRDFIDKMFPPMQSRRIWNRATKRLDRILKDYADIPEGVHKHTDNIIFPSAAIYLTVREYTSGEKAYAVIERASARNSAALGKKLAKLMKLPFMADLFISVWDPMTRKMFGSSSGFKNRFYPKKKGEYRMDVIACPYCRYFTELGCPELTKIFCENDERMYGNLPGLSFERTSTLRKDGERCDFYIRKT